MSKRTPYKLADAPEGAPVYWRSLEEKDRLDDPKLYEERQAEFTPEMLERPTFLSPDADAAGAGDVGGVSRRGFMAILGATAALAGAAGCRRPVEKIVPYGKMPEEIIPGVPSYYATAYARRGESLGLLVECHEGRPTKVEGNPQHPSSLGATDLVTQASVIDLYDPDRSGAPAKAGKDATWADAEAELDAKLKMLAADGGTKLRFLSQPTNSPSVIRLRAAIQKRFPGAKFHTYAPLSESNAREGARLAFGAPLTALPSYDRARVILSLDCDFLQTEAGNVRANKLFAAGRRLRSAADTMSRLYVVEPTFSTTGANADHRLRIPAAQVESYALALAAELANKHGVDLGDTGASAKKLGKVDGIPSLWLAAVAKDLAAAKGRSIVVAGSRQPATVHALAHALNQALGNIGTTVQLAAPADADEADVATDLKALVDAAKAGQVDTLVLLGGNPVYDAPADLAFGEVLAKLPLTVHLSSHHDETSEKCTWHLPRNHEFESWGDQRSLDGTLTAQQPLIAPLRDTRADVELLAFIAGTPERKMHEVVQATFKQTAGSALGTEHAWRRILRDGFVAGSAPGLGAPPALRGADIAAALEKRKPAVAPTKDSLEVVFAACPKLEDGRHANNSWLCELPDPMTKIVWDNAALFSPATARELGIKGGDMVTLSRGNASVQIVAWITPGHADNSITAYLGWGRTKAGRVGNGKGFNVYPLRTSDALHFADGVKVAKTGERYKVSQTQDHNSMEGRPIAREATLATYKEHPKFAEMQSPPPQSLPLWKKTDYTKGHRWGMTIDLNACTGCTACVVACQAENNIHVVGKEQIAKGREMHWLRIDRYFVGDENEPKVAHQPLACVQCEEAPCENVCPVNATAHSPEGLNDMAYNRCIGTRYCANNCPYKVRRFNYLDWKSEFWNPGDLSAKPIDPPQTIQMQYNPDVTVRMRGVMEKCTYCVQRIQRAKIETKRAGRDIRDGEITTACAQACPADAIVFGDLNDKSSRVAKLTELDRRYRLLAEIGTAPRTTYLGKVRNLNPEMETVAPGSPTGSTTAEGAEKHG